jgi:hypothetical protein
LFREFSGSLRKVGRVGAIQKQLPYFNPVTSVADGFGGRLVGIRAVLIAKLMALRESLLSEIFLQCEETSTDPIGKESGPCSKRNQNYRNKRRRRP